MDVVVISRHAATIVWVKDWLRERGVDPDAVSYIEGNASEEDVRGKIVIGNVPLNLAALAEEVWAVEFSGPPPRGEEVLTIQELEERGIRIQGYKVKKIEEMKRLG